MNNKYRLLSKPKKQGKGKRPLFSFAAMGRKNKLKRFADVAGFPNVFEVVAGEMAMVTNGQDEPRVMKGKWAQYFSNDRPLILELACGKGEYTLALARQDPQHNFIGLDIKGARIWKGARQGLTEKLTNAAFLRTRIEFIEYYFAPAEVESIWVTFPDPFAGKPNRRLTSASFLDRYRKFLQPGGSIHLKTDSELLYEFTLDVIQSDPRCKIIYANPDIYNSGPLQDPILEQKTFYELKHLAEGKKITYVEFTIS
jgi:tRNA (guanine-N7-)-methyltransferase